MHFRMINRKNVYSFLHFCYKRNFQTETIKCKEIPSYPNRIFSGIQPTGSMHLGNYLGAIRYWKHFQDTNDSVIYSIVDLHSITLPQDPKTLHDNILEMTATLIACGINPQRSILFQQSSVPQHTELCWYLGCLSTMARLAHLPQYKEKSSTLKDIPLGLFVYPVLQAADVLMYKATQIPVGEDQHQHLQLAQELVRMFNNRFGHTFPTPRAVIANNDLCRVKSLRDPSKKMSKSDPDPKSRINLLDSPDEIMKKLKKAVTDFTSEVYYDLENRPGVSSLISIHSAISGKNFEQISEQMKGVNTGEYKLAVAEILIEHLKPIRSEIIKLMNDKMYLMNILENGARQAELLAKNTIEEVRLKLGLRFNEKISVQYRKIKT